MSAATEPKFPQVEVDITSVDGNAFSIMGAVSKAMRREGIPYEDIETFKKECMSGDYDHLLQTCMRTVTVA
jgi:hypothetical protein